MRKPLACAIDVLDKVSDEAVGSLLHFVLTFFLQNC